MHRRKQMARIIEVAHLIHNQPRKWTRPQLAERFEVDKATIQRDIGLLREMGIVIVPRGKQGYEMISDFFLPPLNLDLKEALALVTAASFFRAADGDQAVESLNSAIHKITSTLPKQTNDTLNQIASQIEVPRQQVSPIDEDEQYKEMLYQAIQEKTMVTIEYNSFSSGKKVRHRLAPYAVLFRKRAWYVIGHSETSKRILTFRINRIESLSMIHIGYTIPDDFSVQKYLDKSWDVMLGPETRVVVLFASRIAPLIKEVNWHPTQQLQDLKNGALRFETTVSGWYEIGWWILSWGHEAKVIRPKALRQWITQTAQNMVALYAED